MLSMENTVSLVLSLVVFRKSDIKDFAKLSAAIFEHVIFRKSIPFSKVLLARDGRDTLESVSIADLCFDFS